MLQACNIKRLLLPFLIIGLVVTSACQSKQIETMTLGDWIEEIVDQAGITPSSSTKPYFIHIDQNNPHFNAVQAAVEWQVLYPKDGFQPDSPLNNEWVAYTLMNLIGNSMDAEVQIKDIQETTFPKEVKAAVSFGLMNLDDRQLFHPKQTIDKQQAFTLLSQAVTYLNQPVLSDAEDSVTYEDCPIDRIQPIFFDEETMQAILPDTYEIQESHLLQWEEDGMVYQIISHDGQNVQLEVVDPSDYLQDVDLSGSEDIDFSNAEIQVNDEVAQMSSLAHHISLLSTRGLSKSFDVNGYQVSLNASGTHLKAEVSRTMPHGSKLYASVKVNSIHVDYRWKSQQKDVTDAFFKVSFQSNEDFGIKNTAYKTLYGDFSKVSSEDYLSSIQNLFQAKNDVVEKTLTIAQIKVPVPSSPSLTLTMNLNLTLKASGMIELHLSQSHVLGCQVRNGKLRLIRELTPTSQANLQASASILTGIHFGLGLPGIVLADIGVDAGARANADAIVHLYDEEGKHTVVNSDVPLDVLDETAEGNGNVLVCGNLNAYWVLDVSLNSRKSLLGKLGLSADFDILNQNHSSLLPGGKQHLENFHVVPKCTRGDRIKLPATDPIKTTEKITLEKYSLLVTIPNRKTIAITGLPAGYAKEDILYTVDDATILQVDETGTLTGLKQGNAVVTISTKDDAYRITCHVMVKDGH